MTAPTILWFRHDLRLHDHEPLDAALRDGGTVLPVYCLDPRQFAETHLGGFPKTGAHRTRFLLEALHDLRQSLQRLGSDLIVRRGEPEMVLAELVAATGAERIRFHEEVASDELAVEDAVAAATTPLGAAMKGAWGHTLLHPDDLPFALDALPELFTHFRVQAEKQSSIRSEFAVPSRMPALPPSLARGEIPTVESLGLSLPAVEPRQLMQFVGGEAAGLQRLEAWIFAADALQQYKERRNGLLTPDDSSKFSPWLSLGCLSPRRIHAAVRRYERQRVKNDSTYWMIFELYWRDYFRFIVAKHGDRIFRAGGLIGARIAWRNDPAWFDAWRTGHTGFPLVDAAMRELQATGFTSNRARQNVASFLTKNLGQDWRLGAAWFESQLVDYDVASNWGNWAYAAGVGNDARGFRFFNIHKQADDYDPTGAFVRHWLPELARIEGGRIHRPDQLHAAELGRLGIRLGADYPLPMVHLGDSAKACERLYEAGTRGSARRPGESARGSSRR